MSYLDEIQVLLKQLKPHLTSTYGVDSLGLFGSIVRDDFTATSDIDIIVTFSKPIGIEFITMADELEDRLQRKVDLVSRRGVKERYLKEIDPEIIYV